MRWAGEEDEKQLSARQRGHSEPSLWGKLASAFNCEWTPPINHPYLDALSATSAIVPPQSLVSLKCVSS